MPKLTKKAIKYIEHCSVYFSKNTAKTYIKFANKFLEESNTQKIYERILSLAVKDTTKNTYISALNNYGKYVNPDKYTQYPKIRIIGTDKELPSGLDKLIPMMDHIKAHALDDEYSAAIYLLASTGLRYGDGAEAIDFSGIDGSSVKQRMIKVKSKGNKWKWVYLPKNYDKLPLNSLNGVSRAKLQTYLNNYLSGFNLSEKLTLHKMRYFFANHQAMLGLSRAEIKTLGGGSSDSVDIYLFDNVIAFRDIAQLQYMDDAKAIAHLDAKGQAAHGKKMYEVTLKRLSKYEKMENNLK